MTKQYKTLFAILTTVILVSSLVIVVANLQKPQDLRKNASENTSHENQAYVQLRAKPVPTNKPAIDNGTPTTSMPRTIQLKINGVGPGLQLAFFLPTQDKEKPMIKLAEAMKNHGYTQFFYDITPVENGFKIKVILLSNIDSLCRCLNLNEWTDFIDIFTGSTDNQQTVKIAFDKQQSIAYRDDTHDLKNLFDTIALADIDLPDPNPPTPTPTPQTINLALSGSIANEYKVGESLNYNLTVSNQGFVTARQVILHLQSSTPTLMSATTPTGNCSNAATTDGQNNNLAKDKQVDGCVIGNMAAGQTITIPVSVRTSQLGTLTLTHSIASTLDADKESDSSNDSLSLTTTIAPTPTSTPTPQTTILPINSADMNEDGKVDITDYTILTNALGETGDPGFAAADINQDGNVDIADYTILVTALGL